MRYSIGYVSDSGGYMSLTKRCIPVLVELKALVEARTDHYMERKATRRPYYLPHFHRFALEGFESIG